jgi:Contractile injection system spike tip protein
VGDFIIKTNDMIQITVPPPAVVPMLAAPVPLIGTGTTVTIGGVPICLQGDECPPSLKAPMPYTAPPFVTPGMGTIQIMLMPNNLTMKTVQGKPVILKGSSFQAMFNVSAPAMQPTPGGPVPDPLLVKNCTCQFVTTNVNTQAG